MVPDTAKLSKDSDDGGQRGSTLFFRRAPRGCDVGWWRACNRVTYIVKHVKTYLNDFERMFWSPANVAVKVIATVMMA